MLELLTNLGFDPNLVLGGMILSALLIFALYRRYIFSLLEPISMFLVAQVGDATIMLALPLAPAFKWQFLAYMLSLWAGFALCAKPIPSSPMIRFSQRSLSDLRIILAVLGGAIILANAYLGEVAGFPLLSADPSAVKETVYTGGLGIVRRINMGPYAFFCAGCTLLIANGSNRRFAITILSLATSLVIFSGGKSVLLPLLFALSFAVAHGGLSSSVQFKKQIRNFSVILLGAGLLLAIVITSKAQGGILGGVQNFMLRLLLAGDVILYYYPRREVVMTLVDANIVGFLRNTFSDTMGLLRLSDYSLPLGIVILGSEEGGPNVQYFIAADLFFGPVAGCLYSFAVGGCMAMLRNGFFRESSDSAVRFTVRLFLAIVAFDLATEAGMFVTEIFMVLLCVTPLYWFACLLRTALNTKTAIWSITKPLLIP